MDTFKQVKQTIVDAAHNAGDTLVDAAKSARDAVIDAKDTVVDAAKDARDKTLDAADDAKQMVTKLADNVTCAIIGVSKDDILDKLKADHETVAGFFEQIEATTSASRALRAGLFEQLRYELEAHSKAEEKTFYAALQRDAPALFTEAHVDHELVQQLLVELTERPVGSEAWLAQLGVLKENVERHVQMEEDELFACARDCMTSARREELGLQFDQTKQRLDGRDRGARGREAQRRPLKSNKSPRKASQHGAHANR